MNPGLYRGYGGEGTPQYPVAIKLFPELSTLVRGTSSQPVMAPPTFTSDGVGASLSTIASNQFDEVVQLFPLAGGRYRLMSLHQVSSGAGIATYAVDSVPIGTIDHYNAVTSRNNQGTLDFEVPYDGMHEIRVSVPTKHGSSVGYNLVVQFWLIYRLAEQ